MDEGEGELLVGVNRKTTVRPPIQAGVNLELRDKAGKTPLDYVEDATERSEWAAKISMWQNGVQE